MMKKLVPPFNKETATAKVQAAEDAWNSKNPEKVAMAYSKDSRWRNRDKFFTGRKAIVEFLSDKWSTELHYKLKKYLWSFTDNRISVRFEYEWQDANTGQWKRTHGNEHWKFDSEGLMRIRDMSANDINIKESQRKF
jgi:nuclear transport factor 2 (NTF2) superfamily protein